MPQTLPVFPPPPKIWEIRLGAFSLALALARRWQDSCARSVRRALSREADFTAARAPDDRALIAEWEDDVDEPPIILVFVVTLMCDCS